MIVDKNGYYPPQGITVDQTFGTFVTLSKRAGEHVTIERSKDGGQTWESLVTLGPRECERGLTIREPLLLRIIVAGYRKPLHLTIEKR
jgi:hypothetical protein